MIDRGKVIKGLECCISEQACKGCPYSRGTGHTCSFNCISDAIVLLKEQEAVKPKKTWINVEHEQPTGHWINYPECLQYDGAFSDDHHVCSECFAVFSHMDNCMEDWKFCPSCGAKMENATAD